MTINSVVEQISRDETIYIETMGKWYEPQKVCIARIPVIEFEIRDLDSPLTV